MPTVAELAGRALAELGIGHAFGVVGSGNFDVTNALRAGGVPYTAARHENGAATMADAYARVSGRPAIVTVHQGCGLTNALTGITEAAKSRTPLIVLAADTAGAAIRSNFKIDQDALARSVGAVAERVHSAHSAVADVTRAYRTAVNERRTVVLNLPLDVQAETADDQSSRAQLGAFTPADRIRPSAGAVRRMTAMLASAERPVFVAGRGGRHARSELLALAEQAGALVATSAVAHGLFHGEEFALGISGGFSSPLAAELITGADLVVGWGCSLNMWTMRQGALIGAGAAVIQVDTDDDALGANRPIDLGVQGDVALTAEDVLAELRGSSGRREGYRSAGRARRIAGEALWNDVVTEDISTDDTIDARELTKELNTILPKDRVVSTDSGNFMGYPAAYLEVPDENGFCFTQSYQSIGLGLGTAIGTALARPDRMAVLGTGDGGFLMNIADLETAVRLKLPMVIIVYNDSAYGAEVHHFSGGDLSTVTFPDTDIASIALGYGAGGITVRTKDDLAQVAEWLAGEPGVPLVIDAKVANDGGSWWLAEAFKGH